MSEEEKKKIKRRRLTMQEMKERASCYNCLFIDLPLGAYPVCVYFKFINDAKPKRLIHNIKLRRAKWCPLRGPQKTVKKKPIDEPTNDYHQPKLIES